MGTPKQIAAGYRRQRDNYMSKARATFGIKREVYVKLARQVNRYAVEWARGSRVKARRDYLMPAGNTMERVRVTGFSDTEVGDGSSEYPKRKQRWCRVRFEGDRKASLLVHPSRLVPM